MQIARVIGNVVSTVKNDTLHGRKFLIAQILGADLKPKGKPMAGVARSARMAEDNEDCPFDSAVFGVIDTIDFIKQ